VGTAAPVNTLSVTGVSDFTGNVGIGTTQPATKLDVRGKIWMQPTTADADPGQTVVTKDYAIKTAFANKGMCGPRQTLIGFDANGNRVCASTDAVKFDDRCPTGSYMSGFNGSGVKVCVPLANIGTCGYRQYMAGISATGSIICKTLSEAGSCAAGKFAAGVDAAGIPSCKTVAEIGSCPAGQTLQGFDASGNPVCTVKANAKTCGGSNIATTLGTDGTLTCTPVPFIAPPSTTAVRLYQCPDSMSNGCGGGKWGSYQCSGQISVVPECHIVVWTYADTWCDDKIACSYIGTAYLGWP
jgi:hypothetical protein